MNLRPRRFGIHAIADEMRNVAEFPWVIAIDRIHISRWLLLNMMNINRAVYLMGGRAYDGTPFRYEVHHQWPAECWSIEWLQRQGAD